MTDSTPVAPDTYITAARIQAQAVGKQAPGSQVHTDTVRHYLRKFAETSNPRWWIMACEEALYSGEYWVDSSPSAPTMLYKLTGTWVSRGGNGITRDDLGARYYRGRRITKSRPLEPNKEQRMTVPA